MPRRQPPPLLDGEHARFIVAGVSVSIAARDSGNVPSISLALGCRVSADRRRVTIFVAASQSSEVLCCVAEQRQIAAVFSQPSTHRTIQLKGEDAMIVPVAAEDIPELARQLDVLAADLATAGYEESFSRTLWCARADDLAAIAFTPSAAFAQTPGPQAGAPLRGGAAA